MQSAACWAKEEFGGANLGDRRRTRRAVAIAAAAAAEPNGLVTQVCKTSSTREGAYRFLNNSDVSPAALGAAHFERTAQRCADQPVVIVPVDQSTLSVTDMTGEKGFGRVGSKESQSRRGLEVMTAVALTPSGQFLGVCGQQWWRRNGQRSPAYAADKRPVTERESGLWTRTIDQVESEFLRLGSSSRPWYQLDRGGDAWHVLEKARDEGLLLTVRAAYNRKLDQSDRYRYLQDAIAHQRAWGSFEYMLKPSSARRYGHSPLRPRHLCARAGRITLRLINPLDGAVSSMNCWVVHVRERRPPQGCDRITWTLLTTYPVENIDDAIAVVYGYTCRWQIEEYHRTWKSGCCNIEQSQLRSCDAFRRWATLLAAVASRVEQLKSARSDSKRNALELATRDEIDAAILLSETKKFKMGRKLTAEQFVTLVAQCGGYTGKSSGGPPGAQTIARGLECVSYAAKGIAAMRKK